MKDAPLSTSGCKGPRGQYAGMAIGSILLVRFSQELAVWFKAD